MVGENGGVWLSIDKSGRLNRGKYSEFAVPNSIREKTKAKIEIKYSDSMKMYEDKEIIVSTEMKDEYDLKSFKKEQQKLEKDLDDLIKEEGEKHLKVGSSTIGNDIADERMGKDMGVERFLGFLKEKGIEPSEFIAFGDSMSDVDMADELKKRGKKVKFVYVGKKEEFDDLKKDYPIEYMPGYSRGTLEYLERKAA